MSLRRTLCLAIFAGAALLARTAVVTSARAAVDRVTGPRLTVAVPGLALARNPIVRAVRRGNCAAAIKLIHPRVSANDAQTAFVAGRMADEGICVQHDAKAAADFLAFATAAGDRDAALEYAALVGLGTGVTQSYAQAAQLCEAAGVAQDSVSNDALGYACTIAGLTAKLLRQSLPAGALRAGPQEAQVQFDMAQGRMQIRATPPVQLGEPAIGSQIAHPLVDLPAALRSAWDQAADRVPRPEVSQAAHGSVELPIDLDMTLEVAARGGKPADNKLLLPGEIYHPE